MVELIPGTSIPITGPGQALQPEGRGDVTIIPDRMPVSMIDESVEQPLDSHEGQQALLGAALRYFNFASKRQRIERPRVAGNTDPTTGNLILQLFEVPQGMQGHLTFCGIDIPGSATISPSAPYSNAASFAFLAVAPPSSGPPSPTAANMTSLRRGFVSFAPSTPAGPIVPGFWTANDSNAPIAYGGEAFYLGIVGGSVAAITSQAIVAVARINLENRE